MSVRILTHSLQYRARLRRSFDRAAARIDSVAVLPREIARRMDERLSLTRMPVHDVLDAGCGPGFGADLLRQRYAPVRLVELDLSEGMLSRKSAAHKGFLPWPRRATNRRLAVCADLQQLPLAESSFDLVWSNLALHWMDDLERALAQIYQVLRPDSLLMFSLFGPDTLKELRAASDGTMFQINRQLDMHDIGDALIRCGYADPVMDMEIVTLTYADVPALLRDLKAHGSVSLTRPTRKGLGGRARLQALLSRYEQFERADKRLPATCEIIYGHAWRPQRRVSPKGERVIDILPKQG